MGWTSTCAHVQRAISDADRPHGRRVRAHVHECDRCAAFAAAIPRRGAELRAIAPALPAAAATGLLARLLGGGSAHAGSTGSVAAVAAGKTATVVVAAKALAVAAVIGTAGVGAVAVLDHPTRSPSSYHAPTHRTAPAPSPLREPTSAVPRTTVGRGAAGASHNNARRGTAHGAAASRRSTARSRARGIAPRGRALALGHRAQGVARGHAQSRRPPTSTPPSARGSTAPGGGVGRVARPITSTAPTGALQRTTSSVPVHRSRHRRLRPITARNGFFVTSP
jgi:hypothetical protein